MYGRSRDRSRARGGSALWSPLALSPALWLRADRGITLASGDVAGWASQSGTRTFSQSTAGARLPYSASGGPNGTPYVELGNGRWLGADTAASDWTWLHGGDVTLWCVISTAGAAPSNYAAILSTTGSTNRGATWSYEDRGAVITGGEGFRVFRMDTGSVLVTDTRSSSGVIPDQTWRAVESAVTLSAGSVISVAGSIVGVTPGPLGAIAGGAIEPAALGRFPPPVAAGGAAIRVCEIIALARAATAAELARTRAYLRARYGVAA